MSKSRFQGSRELLLLVLGLAGAIAVACGDKNTNFGHPGGSAGSSGWTFVPAGVPVGGSPTSGGSSATPGGSANNAGRAGAGGSAPRPPISFKCSGEKPNQPLITSFTGFKRDRWTSPGKLNGGTYIYPEPLQLTEGDSLGFAATIKDYSGLGVWFSGCIDAAMFKGLRFTMRGNAGPTKSIRFYAVANRNRDVDEMNSVGACLPDDPSDPWQTCRPVMVRLPVESSPNTYTVLWSQFADGLPSAGTDGSDILALQWSFDWETGDATYDAQLVIDDLEFVTGAGGAGGAGGGGSGGSGGSLGMAGSAGVAGMGGAAGGGPTAGAGGTAGLGGAAGTGGIPGDAGTSG